MKNLIIPIVVLTSAIFLLSYMTVSNVYSLPPHVSKLSNAKPSDFKTLNSSVKINKQTAKCYVIKTGKPTRVPCPDIIIVGKAIGGISAK